MDSCQLKVGSARASHFVDAETPVHEFDRLISASAQARADEIDRSIGFL